MAVTEISRSPDKRLLGYRFAGVALDLRRQTLSVDGEEIASTPLMLRLMQMLCEADGQLLKRQDLFDRLWPGGQEVSDSSLSQLVWRLRGALGPYGELVATVRRSGLRLDAPVTAEFDFQRPPRKPQSEDDAESPRPQMRVVETPAPVVVEAPIPAPLPQPVTVPVAAKPPRWRLAIGVLAAMLLIAISAYSLWPRDALISAGYALTSSDLQASKPDTPKLAAAAFAAEYAGERSHAQALMKSLYDSDPTTPIPAVMLAWWSADSPGDEAKQWLRHARERITPESPPYLRLFVDYFGLRSQSTTSRGPLNALLDLRPNAWFLQYARAHDQLGNRELAGALRSLQQIPLDIPDADQIAEVLTDRISLGDTAAIALAEKQAAVRADPVLAPYVRGRAAYSRGDLAQSVREYDLAHDAAEERRRYSWARITMMFAALAAIESGAADAAQRADAAARLCHEQDSQANETEMLGFQAYLAVRAGDKELASKALATAWQRNPWDYIRPPLLLIALENGLPPPGDVDQVAAATSTDTVFGGVADLLLAWRAWASNDPEKARHLLAVAREHGIARTYHAEDALLLAARLGEAPGSCRLDPPYPNMLRLTACIGLRDVKKP